MSQAADTPMNKFGPITLLAIVLVLALAYAIRPVHARGFCLFCPPGHHVARPDSRPDEATRPFDPNFCVGVIKAFDDLHPKDLDTFIFSIPADKREQARRCMTDRK
jgi:hypothetical protein